VGGAVGIAVGVLGTLALRGVTSGGGDTERRSAPGSSVAGVDAAPSSRAALWLFGFDTVRVEPATFEHAHALGRPGFGEVRAFGGKVYMASRASGRVGVLDVATNEMSETATLPTDRKEGAGSNLAVTERHLWLVTGDGSVTSITRDRFDDPVTVDAGAGETRVVAVSRRSVVIIIESAWTLTLVPATDDDRSPPSRRAVSVPSAAGSVRGVAAAGGRVWVMSSGGLRWFESSTLREGGSVDLPARSGEARAVAATGRSAWVLVANGATLLRFAAGSATPEASVKLLADEPQHFREPVDVVAGRGAIWVLVPTGADPADRAATVFRVDTQRGAVGKSLDVPSDLFVGAIAIT